MHLCVSLSSSRKGERSQGYVVIGDTSDGRWAQLLPDNGLEYSLDKLEDLRREWQLHEEQARRERLGKEMPAVERDKHNRKILAQLTLNREDKLDLTRRGFTDEQILKSGFKSVERWQKLDGFYPLNLPGINSQGNGLISHTPGYVCPITDCNGLIVGLQVRKRVLLNGDNQRYYFLSQDSSIRINDQVPLAVFPATNSSTIGLTEGLGTKPFLTCSRLGISVIGASGGNWASSPTHLKQSLEKLGATSGDAIAIFPDAGSVTNKAVLHQYTRTTKLLASWGYRVVFAWWGQSVKSLPDIDELQPEQLGWIQYLSVEKFKSLCIKWGGLQQEASLKPTPITYDERVAVAQERLHSLSYAIDLKCDPKQKYLPDLVGRIPLEGIVGLESPKGSGKSTQIKKIKDYLCGYWETIIIQPKEVPILPEQLNLLQKTTIEIPRLEEPQPEIRKVWNKGRGMRFLSINARIALGREQAIKWEFTWIEDADLDGRDEFGGERIATNTILEEIDGIGLCWDSLNKIFGRDWGNTLVVIDEIELGLNHVVTSSTCRDRRSFILHTLEQKLRECLENGGMVLCADADLSNVSLDYLTAIAPGHTPYIVGHDFKGDPWEIDFYTGKRDVVLSQIEEWLSDEHCRPIAVGLDNQKEAESLSMYLTKKYPWLNQEVGGLIRIDSKITQTDFGKKFVQYPNQNLVGGKDQKGEPIKALLPKLLIYTPSLGVGCSIDVPYFAHVFTLAFGNLEPSQVRQMPARIRQSVPRTIWAKQYGFSGCEDEPTSYLPEEIKRRLFDFNDGLMATMSMALSKARELAEQQGISNPEDKDLLPLIIEQLQGMMGPDGTWNNPHLDLYADQIARRNFSLSQFAVQLRQELIDEGHILRDFSGDGSTAAGDTVTAGKKEIECTNARLTATAKTISYEEAKDVQRKPSRTDQEQHSMIKAFMVHDLPGVELTPEFVLKAKYEDNGRWLSQAKLFWHVYNLDACRDKDEREWKYRLNQFSKGVVFLPDIKSDMPKLEAIAKSGVLDWVKPDDLETEYSNESPEGKAFVERCYSSRKLIKTALNITVQRDSEPIKLANRILDRIGLGLTYSRRDKVGNRLRYYKLDEKLAVDGDRQAVWEALNQRWFERQNKIAESQAQREKKPVQNESKILDNNKASGQENKPDEFTTESLNDAVELLQYCEDAETLRYLRDAIAPALLKEAAKLLPQEKATQIRQWVCDQNAA